MTPDEARQGCADCREYGWICSYHRGYANGWDAAQRERGPIQAVGKPLPPHFAQGRPGS